MTIENIGLSPSIEKILNKELKNGNSIAQASKGWSSENSLLIILQRPFKKRYRFTSLRYTHVNDPHYWKEEYTDTENNQTLACKF